MNKICVLIGLLCSLSLIGQKSVIPKPILDETYIVACDEFVTLQPQHSQEKQLVFQEDFENASFDFSTDNISFINGPYNLVNRSSVERFEEHQLLDSEGLFFALSQPQEKVISFTTHAICIDQYENLELSTMLASLSSTENQPWDDDAQFQILYSIDNHAFKEVIDISNSSSFQATQLNHRFQYFKAPISVTGDSIRIQFRCLNFDNQFENIAIDNVELSATFNYESFAFYANIPELTVEPLHVGQSFQPLNTRRQSQTIYVASRLANGEEGLLEKVSITYRNNGTIACQDLINLSLGDECAFQLTSHYLTGTDLYDIELEDSNGDTIPEQIINRDHAETTVVYKLIDKCTRNSCWGLINVEIKKIPTLQSPCYYEENEPVFCELWCGINEKPSGGFIHFEELDSFLNETCFPVVQEKFQTTIVIDTLCEEETHIVTFKGFIDSHEGLQLVTILKQAYKIKQPDIVEIQAPHTVSLTCNSSAEPDSIFNHFYTPGDSLSYVQSMFYSYPFLQTNKTEIVITQIPELVHYEIIIDTIVQKVLIEDKWVLLTEVRKQTADSIRFVQGELEIPVITSFSENDDKCKLKVFKNDLEFPACGRGKKILRSWEIINWCTGESVTLEQQQIELIDHEKPIISEIPDASVSTDPWSCKAVYIFPEIEVFDTCSDSLDITWRSSDGIINGNALTELELFHAPVTVTAVVKDQCHNESRYSFQLDITDDHPPIPRCHNELIISLSQEGTNRIDLEDFNLGSYDNGCGDVWFKAIRADELFRSVDGYWNEEGIGGQVDYTLPPEPVFFPPYPCDNIGADDFEDDFYFDAVTEEFIGFELSFNQIFFDDEVNFCCDDIENENLEVILRVFDKDPGEGPVDPRRYQYQQVPPISIDSDNGKRKLLSTNQVQNDLFGRYADCSVTIKVRSKLLPRLVCEDVELSCLDDIATIRPDAIVDGVCGDFDVLSNSDSLDITDCGIEGFKQEWFVDLDANGTYSVDEPSCIQTVQIIKDGFLFDPYSIRWPKHFDGTIVEGVNLECDSTAVKEFPQDIEMGGIYLCEASIDEQIPVWCNAPCGLVGRSVENDTVAASEVCYKIIRRWTVIDWCTWNANTDNTDVGNNLFEAIEDWTIDQCDSCKDLSGLSEPVYVRYKDVDVDGYYQYDQIIKVDDQTMPDINIPDTLEIKLYDGRRSKEDDRSCDDSGTIRLSGIDICENSKNNSLLDWSVQFLDGHNNPTFSYTGNERDIATPMARPGTIMPITIRLIDACGNESQKDVILEYIDAKSPVPICVGALQTTVSNDNVIDIWASDFDFGSYDNCGNIQSVTAVFSGETPLRPHDDDFESQRNLQYSCDSLSMTTDLDIWFWDESGNGDFCQSSLLILDECTQVEQGRAVHIGGQITSIQGQMMKGVMLNIDSELSEYPKSIPSTSDGLYSFDSNPVGFDYSISAVKDKDYLNGITTLDVLRIQQHVTGEHVITDPYLFIAADVNNDEDITALDIVSLRNALLGLSRRFPNNSSWRFVDQSSEMDIERIWPFKERINHFNVDGDEMTSDFMGIKIGDLNMSASSNGLQSESRYENMSELFYHLYAEGEYVIVDFYSNENSIRGFQLTLRHKHLDLLEISSPTLSIDKNHFSTHDFETSISWSDNAEVHQSQNILFTAIFKRNLLIKSGISLSSILSPEMYQGESLSTKKIVLTDKEALPTEINIFPNPFYEKVDISFPNQDLPQVLRIFNVNGTEVIQKNQLSQHFQIDKSEFDGFGLYYLNAAYRDGRVTTKTLFLVNR